MAYDVSIDSIKAELELGSTDMLHSNDDYIFRQACYNRDTNLIKWLYGHSVLLNSEFPENVITDILLYSNLNDNTETFEILIELLKTNSNIKQLLKIVFLKLCENNKLTNAKQIYEKCNKKTIDLPLIFASICRIGHVEILEWLFEIYPNKQEIIHYRDELPFIKACEGGHMKVIDFLIDPFYFVKQIPKSKINKINFGIKNSIGLKIACKYGYEDIVKFLSDRKNVDIHASEEKPLRNACEFGHLEIAKMLCRLGANLDLVFKDHYHYSGCIFSGIDTYDTCLDYCIINAYKNNNLHIIIWLCQNAFVDLRKYKINSTDFLVKACQTVCINSKPDEIINALDAIDFIYDYCKTNGQYFSIKTYIYNYNDEHNPFIEDKLFLEAVKTGNLDIVKKIYNLGLVTLEPIDIKDTIPQRSYERSIYEIVTDPDITISGKIFHTACKINGIEIVEWLLEICCSLGINVDLNTENCLCLRTAYDNDNLELFKIILTKSPVKINYRACNDFIFYDSCNTNNIKFVEFLLSISKYYCAEIIEQNVLFCKVFFDEITCFQHLENQNYFDIADEFHIKISNKFDPLKIVSKCSMCKRKMPQLITKCKHRYCFECLFNGIYIHSEFKECKKCNREIRLYECKFRHSVMGWLLY